MLIVVGEAAALLAGRGESESGEGGVHETEFCAMDLMQKPGVGARETLVVADIVEREGAERGRESRRSGREGAETGEDRRDVAVQHFGENEWLRKFGGHVCCPSPTVWLLGSALVDTAVHQADIRVSVSLSSDPVWRTHIYLCKAGGKRPRSDSVHFPPSSTSSRVIN